MKTMFFMIFVVSLSHNLSACHVMQKVKQADDARIQDMANLALSQAVGRGNVTGVQRALKAGADPYAILEGDKSCNCGANIFAHAIDFSNISVIKELIKASSCEVLQGEQGVALLIRAINDMCIIKLLLKSGVDFNKISIEHDNITPLQHACRQREWDVVQLYLALGADYKNFEVELAKLQNFDPEYLQTVDWKKYTTAGCETFQKRLAEYQKSQEPYIYSLITQDCEGQPFLQDLSNIIVAYAIAEVPVTFDDILDDEEGVVYANNNNDKAMIIA